MKEKMSVRDSSPPPCLHSVFLLFALCPWHNTSCTFLWQNTGFFLCLQSGRQPGDTRQQAGRICTTVLISQTSVPRRQISRRPAEQYGPQCVLCISEGEETELLETFPIREMHESTQSLSG